MLTVGTGVVLYVSVMITLLLGSYLLFRAACRFPFIRNCIQYSGVVTVLMPVIVLVWWIWENQTWQPTRSPSAGGVIPAATAASTAPVSGPSPIIPVVK